VKKDRRKGILKEWEKLRKKYKLPKLEELEKEFDFYTEGRPVLSEVLKRVALVLDLIRADLESILHPRGLGEIVESKFFKEEEKDKLFDFYREVRAKIRKVPLAVMGSEEEKVRILKEFIEFYREKAKQFSKKFYEEISKKWMEKEAKEREITYLR